MKRRVNYCLTSHQEPTIQLTIVGATDYTHEVWFYSFCCSLLNFTLGYSFNKKDIKDKQRMCQQSLHHQGVCVCAGVCTRAHACSIVSDCFATPWTVALQAPLSMGFSRQEYWSSFNIPFSRGSSRPKDQTRVSCLSGKFSPWATWEVLPYNVSPFKKWCISSEA